MRVPFNWRWVGLKKLDVFILKKFIGTFIFAILILVLISIVIDWSQKVNDFASHKAPTGAILNYFKNFAPYIASLLYPLFIFIAAIFFTSKMAYKTEVIAMLATGTSFQRFLRPYFIGGGLLGGLALLGNHFIVPAANKQRLDFEDRYVHETVYSSRQNIHLRLTPQLYVYLQRYDFPAHMAYKFTAETIKGTLLTEKIMAETAGWDSTKQEWTLHDVAIRTNDGLRETLRFEPELKRRYAFTPKDLLNDNDDMQALTTPELLRTIQTQKTRGAETLNFFYVELHKRSAQPYAGLVLVVIGACIASRKIRGGSGFHLALGIMISAVYIMLLQFSTTLSTKGGLSPLLSVWIPNILFTGIAVALYRRQAR